MAEQTERGPDNAAAQQQTPWHAMASDQALQRVRSSDIGLSEQEAQQRLQRDGPNRLKPPARETAIKRFLRQFHNILIYILIIAAGVTALMQHWTDAGVIMAVVLINTIIGFMQESKAERAIDSIRQMLSPEATVIRDGRRQTIAAEQLVVGDIVVLESGDKVPADVRLLKVRDLRADEAVLTGESVPAEKSTDPAEPEAGPGDQPGMAFSGTLVSSGHGKGVVVATGDDTQIGRISQMLGQVSALTTPLLQQVAHFGRVLSVVIVVLAILTFAIGMLAWGEDWADMFLAAVGLAVAAIPEGLPAILTITLAIGVQRMADRHAIIRHLPAVDTLGSVTVICSDKTGTLTRNEMTVRTIITGSAQIAVSGVGYEPAGSFTRDGKAVEPDDVPGLAELLRAGHLCNDASVFEQDDAWQINGDPTEASLLTAAMKAGLDLEREQDAWPRRDAIPFASEHRYMATLHEIPDADEAVVYLKGAPERVLEMCDRELVDGQQRELDAHTWHERMEELAGRGQRTLALAYKHVPSTQQTVAGDHVEQGLTLLGLVGMIDPPRDQAIEAVRECRSAGIAVKMITGDHARTALAIGQEMGIGDGKRALTGRELDQIELEDLRNRARSVDVFARVSPEHKLRLVEATQQDGHVVAMTGDGVNDAPALKRADVGIAMGIKGTEVSKEASKMVLADDNFASITAAVREGRTVYDNLRKAIMFILPTNGGQSLVILAAVIFGMAYLPITPVQILWVNMVTAVTLALALAFEPPEPGVMQRPPRAVGASLLDWRLLWRILFVSLLLWAGTFGMFSYLLAGYGAEGVELARTGAVNTLVLFQVAYLFNSRYITASSLSAAALLGSRYVLLAIGLIAVLQGLYTYLPLAQELFDTRALPARYWLMMAPGAVAVFLLVELEKWITRRWTSDQ